MQNFYFTFMQKQQLLRNYYVHIEAPNEAIARKFFSEDFGLRWAFTYREHDFTEAITQYNLKCLFKVSIDSNGNIIENHTNV